MNTRRIKTHESGIALFAVLFALLLLSVIGLGMMYSTNTETSINANYKDSQMALYAALAGAQEARDRIQPSTGDITLATALPSTSAANVIYILNGRGGETVAPWDMTGTYPDTELCQEKVMGLTGTVGVPCTTVPTGSSWYRTVNNYTNTTSVWHLSTPLDTKWTRITLKGNNMTAVAANGNSSTATQVCWDGYNQVSLPSSGYGTNCRPNGSIATLTLTAVGSGYTSTPVVTISAPPSGGTQATASIQLSSVNNGQVASISVGNPGSGYVSAPSVSLTGGGGTGATAVAVIAAPAGGAPVASVALGSSGAQCYATAPTVSITGGGGSGATATAVLAGTKSCIASWSPTAHCTTTPPKNTTVTGVTLSGGGGTGFSGTLVFGSSGSITSYSIENPGSGFIGNPTTAGGGSPALGSCSVTPNAVAGYLVQSLTLGAGGGGYTSDPALTIASGAGTAVATPTGSATKGAIPANAGQVTAINVTNPGSGYTSAPSVDITGGGGTSSAGTAMLGVTNVLNNLTITNAGSGYTTDPTISFTGGGGTGAQATATIGRGPNYGTVFLITSFAQTASGARAMAQMEATTAVLGYSSTGALTLAGPSPSISGMPNSDNFVVNGNDANSCSQSAEPVHPAIDGYDDPNNPTPTSSVETITTALPRPDHYLGAGGTPSVQNGYDALGETMGTPTGLKALLDAIRAAPGANIYTSNPASINTGTASSPVINYVDGDLTLNGSSTGYGILVVTGTLNMGGSFNWKGPVLVVGDGVAAFNGGGNGLITGTMIVAKIWDSYTTKNLRTTLGSPTISWVGGGTNGVLYDHCWATNLMSTFPFTPPPSTRPLKVLSTRVLP